MTAVLQNTSASSFDTSASDQASSSEGANDSVTSVTQNLDKLGNSLPPPDAVSTPAVPETHASTQHAPAHEDQGGLPQLKYEQWPGQMVWLVVIFTIFFTLIAKVFAPKLRRVIETRGSTIAEDLANARAIRDEAEAQAQQAKDEINTAHAEARKLASEAKARIARDNKTIQDKEDQKLAQMLSQAEASIRKARDEALTHVEDIATETAQAMIEKLTGKAPSKSVISAALKNIHQ